MRFIITTYDEHRGRDASEQLVVKSCLSPVEGGENSSFRADISVDSTNTNPRGVSSNILCVIEAFQARCRANKVRSHCQAAQLAG